MSDLHIIKKDTNDNFTKYLHTVEIIKSKLKLKLFYKIYLWLYIQT